MTTHARVLGLLTVVLSTSLVSRALGDLLLYEPFNYTVGDNLGGVDPDGTGPMTGTAVGQSGTYAAGGTYTWHARSAGAGYQSAQDTVVSSGNLSYAGLATSQGNSVSYGSALVNANDPLNPNDIFNKSLYADSVALPAPVTSGSLYASFIIRIKSRVEDGGALADRHAPAGFVKDVTPPGTLGQSLAGQSGTSTDTPGMFWFRRDPATLAVSNLGAGKASGDGSNASGDGDSASYQITDPMFNGVQQLEGNQFGDLDGQPMPEIGDPASYLTYFVVLKYEYGALNPARSGQSNAVSLWVNPGSGTLGTATGEADASQAAIGSLGSYYGTLDTFSSGTVDTATINSFALIGHRQTTNNTFAADFDELRIGTTWQDVTPTTAAPMDDADFDMDGDVDGADFLTWQRGLGQSGAGATKANGNANNDTVINGADLAIWRAQFGLPAVAAASAIPEPASLLLAAAGLLAAAIVRRNLL